MLRIIYREEDGARAQQQQQNEMRDMQMVMSSERKELWKFVGHWYAISEWRRRMHFAFFVFYIEPQ